MITLFYLYGAMLAYPLPITRRWYGDALLTKAGEWLRDAEQGVDDSIPDSIGSEMAWLSIACAYALAGVAWEMRERAG